MAIFMVLMFLVMATIGTVIIGEKTGLPWPALTTIVTTIFVFIPGTPAIEVPPELILPIFLPPLLWALARKTSWGVIREQWITITALSVLLVVATVFAVGAVTYLMIPAMGFASAMVVGAAVAPPDPVAVEAVAEPAGIPRRILSALQTEGLFNDAVSIVAFHLALAAVTEHEHVTPLVAVGTFLYAAAMAVVLGLLAARGAAWVVEHVEGPSARNVFVWVVPFVTYILAEELHASGVIAVVVAGIEMHSRASIEAEDRLSSSSFWDTVDVLFTGAAFGMIGLTVSQAIEEVGNQLWAAVGVGVAVAFVAIAVRVLMLAIVAKINRVRGRAASAPLRAQEVLLMSWCGMRGLVTLALVLSVPIAGFPARYQLSVIALTVLLVTMVIPGLALPLLMKVLDVTAGPAGRSERMRARVVKRARDAAAQVMKQHYEELDPDVSAAVQHWFEQQMAYSAWFTDANIVAAGEKTERKLHAEEVRRAAYAVRREAIAAAQQALLEARNERGINPMMVDEVLREIDRLAVLVARQPR